jgi:hypothetical protein
MKTIKVAFLTNVLRHIDHLNIGDVFIGKGLMWLLKKVEKDFQFNFFPVSRFSPWDEETKEFVKSCDLIIYGGMPQYNNLDDWCFYYDDQMWNDIQETGVPVLRLAGGGGYPSITMTPEEFSSHLSKSQKTLEVLNRTLSFTKMITTRDPMAHIFLKEQGIANYYLPCSGTFACRFYGVHSTTKEFNAICTSPHLYNHPNKEIHFNELKKIKKYFEVTFNKECKVICQVNISDKKYLIDEFGSESVFVASHIQEMIDMYSKIDICLTSRLHCALPIHGIGGRAILVRVDTRATAGEKLEIPILTPDQMTLEQVQAIVENDSFSKLDPNASEGESIRAYLRIQDII